ncbi:MAG: hypothetical protein HY735_19030 [Verrucomicrobia bacterium]|nr:hypothetical protein [Verrucomicrobiota bacterium]
MARNRKSRSSIIRLGPGLKVCLFCVGLAAAAIGYVGQKSQLQALGTQYKELETRLGKLRSANGSRARILDSLQTPFELEARIKQMNLGLAAPAPDQTIRLRERVPTATETVADRLYANQNLQMKEQR